MMGNFISANVSEADKITIIVSYWFIVLTVSNIERSFCNRCTVLPLIDSPALICSTPLMY